MTVCKESSNRLDCDQISESNFEKANQDRIHTHVSNQLLGRPCLSNLLANIFIFCFSPETLKNEIQIEKKKNVRMLKDLLTHPTVVLSTLPGKLLLLVPLMMMGRGLAVSHTF